MKEDRLRFINETFSIKESDIEFIGKINRLDENTWYNKEGCLMIIDEFRSDEFKEEIINDLIRKYVLLLQTSGPYPCFAIGLFQGFEKTQTVINFGNKYRTLILENGIIKDFKTHHTETREGELKELHFCINSNVTEILEISEKEYLTIKNSGTLKINQIYGKYGKLSI